MKRGQVCIKKLQPEYHLIVTEGTDTEPAYFDAIRSIINRNYKGRIQLDIFGEGDNTISLFRRARDRAANSANIYRHVWIVYDVDDFPSEHVDAVVQLCNESSNEETEYHAIWSNQCIELWFLLHFSYMHSDIHRTEYWPKLTEWFESIGVGTYQKNRQDVYEILRPYMEHAIRNAKKLDVINSGRMPSQAAPGTKVYELVEKLKRPSDTSGAAWPPGKSTKGNENIIGCGRSRAACHSRFCVQRRKFDIITVSNLACLPESYNLSVQKQREKWRLSGKRREERKNCIVKYVQIYGVDRLSLEQNRQTMVQ